MRDNNLNWWNNKWLSVGCTGAALAIMVALIVSGIFANPGEKINEQIEQENYSQVIKIYDEKVVNTNYEAEYRAKILTIIAEAFEAWQSGDLPHEEAKVILEGLVSSEDAEITNLCRAHLSYIMIEEEGKRLLEEARNTLAESDYVDTLKAIAVIDPAFTQYESVQRLAETCTERVLQSVSEPEVEEDFKAYIDLLDECYDLLPLYDFVSRRI